MKFLKSVAGRASIGGELLIFLWVYKRWWIIPMVLTLLLISGLLLFAQSSSIGPFIYSLF